MEKALILVGEEETPQGRIENYQLLIDCEYISAQYDGSSERTSFLDEVSDTFVSRILKQMSPLEVGIYNGLKINPQTGRNERIPKLGEELVAQLTELVTNNLMQSGIPGIIPVSRN